jgi:hypothetical protein
VAEQVRLPRNVGKSALGSPDVGGTAAGQHPEDVEVLMTKKSATSAADPTGMREKANTAIFANGEQAPTRRHER